MLNLLWAFFLSNFALADSTPIISEYWLREDLHASLSIPLDQLHCGELRRQGPRALIYKNISGLTPYFPEDEDSRESNQLIQGLYAKMFEKHSGERERVDNDHLRITFQPEFFEKSVYLNKSSPALTYVRVSFEDMERSLIAQKACLASVRDRVHRQLPPRSELEWENQLVLEKELLAINVNDYWSYEKIGAQGLIGAVATPVGVVGTGLMFKQAADAATQFARGTGKIPPSQLKALIKDRLAIMTATTVLAFAGIYLWSEAVNHSKNAAPLYALELEDRVKTLLTLPDAEFREYIRSSPDDQSALHLAYLKLEPQLRSYKYLRRP